MRTYPKDPRTQYFGDPMPAGGLRQYHRSEQEIAGVIATETCHPPRFRIPRHAHNLVSFYVVLEGSLTEFYGPRQRDLEACNVVFTPPGEVHSNSFHQAGGRCFLVELTPVWRERLRASDIRLDRSVEACRFELGPLAIRLYRECRSFDKVSPLAVEGLVLEILAAFSRQFEKTPTAEACGWLRDARDLVRERFSETLTLGEIAAHVRIHPVRLARSFRARYRCSLAEYQRRLRVEHAFRELVSTRRRLAEIAASAGFADQAHFSRVFKAYTGLTPARFRSAYATN